MTELQLISSSTERQTAMFYLLDSLQGSLLAEHIGSESLEKGTLTLVTSAVPPPGLDYFTDWNEPSCTDWLNKEITGHVQQSPRAIVLLEDAISSQSDPYFLTRDLPAYWCFRDRIFWPVTQRGINERPVEQVVAWSAGFRIIAGFSLLSDNDTLSFDTHLLSPTEFQQVATSLTRLVIDVFAGAGFLVWESKMKGRK